MGKTVFIDRDGVINVCPKEHDYVKKWDEFHFLSGAAEGIRMLNEAGYQVIVVTNQRGVARGLMTMQDVNDIHKRMCRELEIQGAHIDCVFVCPHNDGECSCRKPQPGLLIEAERRFDIDKRHSWMVGDDESDMEAGRRYGISTILIGSKGSTEHSCKSLKEAALIILESELSK